MALIENHARRICLRETRDVRRRYKVYEEWVVIPPPPGFKNGGMRQARGER